MIVGTAGHIDHGKTTLVRALTGVDTDRLPEEKKRGISIELGYAFMDLPGLTERVGFVDVPGHERLVHTMLAGATGIDYAMLLIAADDGVMPQTREHLAVLSLLGLSRGVVLVTKADRADPERAMVEARQLIADTPLAQAPVLAVSAQTGAGLDALRELLRQAALEVPTRHHAQAAFRLAVDRAFTLDGVGTVATGTIHAGEVRVGDELALVPGSKRARVRSLHAQNRSVQQAHAGQRCAVGLAGIAKDEVPRGSWWVSPSVALATQRIDARITLWHGEPRALRSGTAVHVHLGATDAQASVAVLDGDAIAPGGSGRIQLVMREEVSAWTGDRVVLRDASASRTMAGGIVLDPFGPVRYRRTPQRLEELDALAALIRADGQHEHASTVAPAALALLDSAPLGVDFARLAQAHGLLPGTDWGLPDAGPDTVPDTGLATDPGTGPDRPLRAGDWRLGAAHRRALAGGVVQALSTFHAAHPDELGPDAARLRRLTAPRLPETLWRALLAGLQARGEIAVRGAFVHLPEHGVRLSATEERIAQKVGPQLVQAGNDGAWVRDLARACNESEALLRITLARLARRGELHQVVRDLFYPAATMELLAITARGVAAADGEVTAAAFRDATRLGRKRAIQILEYFDRIGLLRRVGDVHRLRADCELFREAQAA